MRRLLPAMIAAWFCVLLVPNATLGADPLDVAQADKVHQAAVKRSTKIATEAIAILQEVEALNEKARGLGVPTSKLPAADIKTIQKNTERLGYLYSNNVIEASLVRDMKLLDNLYKTAMLLHAQQSNYVDQTGSARGLDQYLAGLKLDREQHFYMEILLYLHRLVPSELEANPGTPSQNPSQ